MASPMTFPSGLNAQAAQNMGGFGMQQQSGGFSGPTISSHPQTAGAPRDPIQIPYPTPYGPTATRHSAPTLSPPRGSELRHFPIEIKALLIKNH